jgi:hypothetical protein
MVLIKNRSENDDRGITELGSMKLFAILEALVRKGHIRQREMKYFLKKPLEFFKEPEE